MLERHPRHMQIKKVRSIRFFQPERPLQLQRGPLEERFIRVREKGLKRPFRLLVANIKGSAQIVEHLLFDFQCQGGG